MDALFQYGLQGVVAFGAVGALSYIKKDIPAEVKLGLLFVIAFAVGFVPVDLGNIVLTKIKDAGAIALGVHALYTGSMTFAKKMGTK